METNKEATAITVAAQELTPDKPFFVNKKNTPIRSPNAEQGFKTDTIHGNKRQTQRERILNKLRKERVQILVANEWHQGTRYRRNWPMSSLCLPENEDCIQ